MIELVSEHLHATLSFEGRHVGQRTADYSQRLLTLALGNAEGKHRDGVEAKGLRQLVKLLDGDAGLRILESTDFTSVGGIRDVSVPSAPDETERPKYASKCGSQFHDFPKSQDIAITEVYE